MASTNWNHNLFRLYASLKPNVNYAQVTPKIKGLVEKYAPAAYSMLKQEVIMQPMEDWHLYTVYKKRRAGRGTHRLYPDVRRHRDIGVGDRVY